jgi:putative endonuclease
MDERRKLGNEGEDLAARFLKGVGYKILERQFRTKFGEIDLVAKDGREIVFVEVKTRQTLEFGHPEEAVHPVKLAHMSASGEGYLSEKRIESAAHRYDVVAITWPEGQDPEILHLKNVGHR